MTEFLRAHRIIGTNHPDFICVDTIVDDPTSLIEKALVAGYHISTIIFWDRVRIGVGGDMGYGGPSDPRAPTEFFFSETAICKSFDRGTSMTEYIGYLEGVRDKYPNHSLYPSFTIMK